MSKDSNSISEQFYNMFVTPDLNKFNENKISIEELKKLDASTFNIENFNFGLKYTAERDWRDASGKINIFNKTIDQLNFLKKIAMERAKDEALRNNLPLSEANRLAERAGQTYINQISNLNYTQLPALSETLNSSLKNKTIRTEEYTTAHNNHFNASMNLQSTLFDQAGLASDIARNTQQYNFLSQTENISKNNFDQLG